MTGWQVARLDVHRDLVGERREAVLAWVSRHGVDPDDVIAQLTVSSTEDGPMRLHLSRFHRNEAGAKVADLNLDVIATTPLVIDIDPNDPPPWLRPTTKE